jgi:hypothetical protein
MPVGLERIIMNALRKERDKRMPSIDALRSALEPYLEDSSLRRALGPPISNPDRSLDPKRTLTPPSSGLAHSTFPKMLERALHMRVLLMLGGLASLIAVAALGLKLSGAPSSARLPAKAPAIGALAMPPAPAKLADSVAPPSPLTGALSLLPVAEHDAGVSLGVTAAAPVVIPPPPRRSPTTPTLARNPSAPRGAAATPAAKSKVRLAEFGIASDNSRRKRVETPRLDEF